MCRVLGDCCGSQSGLVLDTPWRGRRSHTWCALDRVVRGACRDHDLIFIDVTRAHLGTAKGGHRGGVRERGPSDPS